MRVPIETLTRILTTADIVGAWLFGSAVNGLIPEGGDLDLGLLFKSTPTLDRLCELRAALQEALGFEEIDLVVLDSASPILRFEALCGRRIVCADPDRCAAFASITAREYEDEMAQCARHLRRGTS